MSVGTTSPESARKSNARYKAKPENKAKLRAHRSVQTAIANGTLKKPDHCARCGKKTSRLIFHHNKGYGKSSKLKGRFLCSACHAIEDPAKHGKRMSSSMKKAKSNK